VTWRDEAFNSQLLGKQQKHLPQRESAEGEKKQQAKRIADINTL
jgi:hypothetical protein